jgi:hypothetical protein
MKLVKSWLDVGLPEKSSEQRQNIGEYYEKRYEQPPQ